MKRLIVCMLLPGMFLAACSDDEENNYDPIYPPDMVDMPDVPEDQPDMTVCMPQTQCPVGTCGQVDDGCGGMLDCGQPITECPVGICGQIDDGCGGTLNCGEPKTCQALGCGTHDDGCGGTLDCGTCLCDGGQPVNTSCGPCELGTTECNAGSNEGRCSVTSIPALDNLDAQACNTRLLYVDARAQLGGDGSKSKPHRLYANALSKAGFGDVIVMSNNDTFTEVLDIKDGVSVLGGFNRNGDVWTYTGVATRIEAAPGTRPIAILARDITNPTSVEDLAIRGADATGDHAIGLLAERASSLTLKRVSIHSGHAGDGQKGADGQNGADGVDGQSARIGQVGSHNTFATQMNRPVGGAGGVNTECVGASGGKGADGTGRTGNVLLFENGSDASDVRGSEGTGGTTLSLALLYPNDDQRYPLSGSGGYSGTIGAVGVDGVPGFKWDNGQVVIEGHGTDGVTGGHGGGGGGGGAHALYTYYNLYSSFDPDPALVWSWSPSGGGGGTGGCGGTGGKGGQAGYGAFGAIVVDGNPTLIDVQITGGAGGNGAEGGFGGLGGQPGFGGSGTNIIQIYDGIIGGTMPGGTRPGNGTSIINALMYLQSGNGGSGGYGAEGGNGGNGSGGPTVGMWCVNATPVTERFSARSSGPGLGAGTAMPGQVIDSKGCP